MIEMTVRGVRKLHRDIQAEKKRQHKALYWSVRESAAALRLQLKSEIRAGAPGGRRIEGLTRLARRKRDRKSWLPDKPLARLANPIFYQIRSQDPIQIAVGWTGQRGSGGIRRIAERLQEGFTSPVSERRGRFFMHRGQEISDRSAFKKYFFLRKSTRQLTTPARPIIEPFWADEKAKAMADIRRRFRLKLMGRRT